MQTIGERLHEARTRQGLSIHEAATATKVRSDYIESMENNQFDNIPLAEVYKRGFLKIYAKFLRCDVDRMVNEFNTPGLTGRLAPARKAQREGFGRLEVNAGVSEKISASPGIHEDPQEIEFSPSSIDSAPHSEYDLKKLPIYIFAILTLLGLIILILFTLNKCSAGKTDTGNGTTTTTTTNGQLAPVIVGGTQQPIQPVTPQSLQYNIRVYTTATARVKIYQEGGAGTVFLDDTVAPQRDRNITVSGTINVTADKPYDVKVEYGRQRYFLDRATSPNAPGFRITDPYLQPNQ